VREVMTPRPNIVAISSDATLEQLRQLVINEQYSRIPVYERDIDHIAGFVHVRDMFEVEEEARERRMVRELVRSLLFVPETKPVSDLMRQMQRENTHMVIVVDEYGNTAGLATMEDLLEVIIGEIRDEHEPDSDVTKDGRGGCIVSGSFDLDRVGDLFPAFHREEDIESTTVAGWLASGWDACPGPGRWWIEMASASRCWPATICASARFALPSLKRWPMSSSFRSGFVSLVGRPNTGKSTLLNALVGQKVAIVADKPQTTRTSIQGVVTRPEAQIVFVDTPGIHKADSPLNKRMMDAVRAALEERDLLLLVVDATQPVGEEDRRAVDLVRKSGTPVVLVLNKIDLVKEKARLLPLISQYKEIHEFADYLPVSAVKGDGLEDLRQAILARLPEGPAYFPEDYVTDQPERYLAAELIREKVLHATRKEVPHAVARDSGQVGRNAHHHPDLRHHPRGARGPEGHRHRNRGRHAQEDRHAGASGDGAFVRSENLSGPARARGAGVARKARLPERAGLAYNGR